MAEYIIELGQARKWQKIKKNVAVGDLVLEIDPNSDSGSWSMAVIKEVLPSEDGLVRKVVITTNGKDYTRPITRLAPLEYNIS
jgi:putative ribosome biogenesis GTPase RsgA